MSQYNQAPQRQMNALDHRPLKLYAKKPENASGAPTLTFKFVNNVPRIQLYTNVESDFNRGGVNLQMEAPYFFSFLEAWKEVCDGKTDRVQIEVKRYTFFKGQRSEERKVIGKLMVGRADNGAVFVALTAQNITPVQFVLGGGFEMTYKDRDGNDLPPKTVSELVSRGWIKMLGEYMSSVADTHYIHKEAKKPNGGGGYNGGGQGGGGGYNNQQNNNSQPSNNFDSDVAF